MKNITFNQLPFSAKKKYRIHRIDVTVNNYFDKNPSINEIPAIELMPLFISKGIFIDDIPEGKHIKILLQEIHRTGQMHLFQSVHISYKQENKQWYFYRM